MESGRNISELNLTEREKNNKTVSVQVEFQDKSKAPEIAQNEVSQTIKKEQKINSNSEDKFSSFEIGQSPIILPSKRSRPINNQIICNDLEKKIKSITHNIEIEEN